MVWPYKLDARLRHLLRRQQVNDLRNIRPVWLWVFDVEESPEDEVYQQTSRHLRKFRDPIPAHLYIDPTEASEIEEGGNIDRKQDHRVLVSLAETYRLADALGDWWPEAQYKLRPQDVYQWEDVLYELQDGLVVERRWGTAQHGVLFSAPATVLRLDSVAVGSPLTIRLEEPPVTWPPELTVGKAQG